VERGADLTATDNNQHNAMQAAKLNGHDKLAKILQKMMNE